MLLLIAGLPATGKTTLAEALARRTGALHYNSDKTRGAMDLLGKYDTASKQAVYEALLEATEAALKSGKSVIVDATFTRKRWRERFEDLAAKHHAPIYWVLLHTSPENIYSRMQHKRKYSEADFLVYQHLVDTFEPFNRPHLSLHSDARHLRDMVNRTLQYIEQPQWDETFNTHRS